MRVSVIIPNYNHAGYLKKRIDSVLNQTYKDFEVIILDDCSTDNSAGIINQYKHHPKVSQIVYNKQNSGSTFKQWEKGVALAGAEYVWIAESDDYADENFLKNAMARFEQNTGLGLYFCDYYSIDEQDGIVSSNNIYPKEFTQAFAEDKAMDGKYFCEEYLFFSSLILNASAVVFTRALFVNADKSYMQLKVSGDWRMWVNICYNTKIFFDEKKMNFFRMHRQNVRTAKASLMGAEAVKNMVYFVKKTQDKALKQKLKDAICKTWVYSFYLDKGLELNYKLIKNIMLVDFLFPVRLLKRISGKYMSKKLTI